MPRCRLEVSGRRARRRRRALAPEHWADIVVPARNIQSDARHRRMDLRALPSDGSAILWLTKDEPVLPR